MLLPCASWIIKFGMEWRFSLEYLPNGIAENISENRDIYRLATFSSYS